MTLDRRTFLHRAGALAAAPALLGVMNQSLSAGEAEPRPNFLFFFPDQHRFDWTCANPSLPLRTPHFQRLAAEGVRFSHAYCPSPLCAPSRACLASGKEYAHARVPSNQADYPLDQPTFYQQLRRAGYQVLGCGKFDLHKASPIWGLDGRARLDEWGFTGGIDNGGKWDAVRNGAEVPRDPYMAFLHQRGLAAMHVEDFNQRNQGKQYVSTFPTPLPDDAYCDNWIAENGLHLLQSVPPGQPWFLQVNFAGPHPPVDITRSMEKTARGRAYPAPHQSTQYDAEKHNAIRQNYSAMIENIDRGLGRFLDELQKRNERARTIVIYSSDHGEMLGDHDLWGKSKPQDPAVRVPLLFSGPGIARGRVSDALVSLSDLAATFIDLAGAASLDATDGRSLKSLLRGDQSALREYVVSALNPWRMVFDGKYKLVEGYGEADQIFLYDLLEDPGEDQNLASKATDVVKRLHQILEASQW